MELYRLAMDAYNRGDVDAFIAMTDPAVEWVPRTSGVEGGVTGHDGVRSWWEDQVAAFDALHTEVHEVVDGGDWVVARVTSHMRGGESGVELDIPFGHAAKMANGRCVRFESFHTFEEALEAAGLSE